MSAEVYVDAKNIWKFFQDNKARLSNEMVMVAENTDTQYAVYLSENKGLPMFSVCKGDDDAEYEEYVQDEEDCIVTTKRLFIQYLFPVRVVDDKEIFLKKVDEAKETNRQLKEDISYERKDELTLALCDFLSVVLEDEVADSTDLMNLYGEPLLEEILQSFLEYLAQEQFFPIYYPMFVTDLETGEEEFAEYPFNDDERYLK